MKRIFLKCLIGIFCWMGVVVHSHGQFHHFDIKARAGFGDGYSIFGGGLAYCYHPTRVVGVGAKLDLEHFRTDYRGGGNFAAGQNNLTDFSYTRPPFPSIGGFARFFLSQSVYLEGGGSLGNYSEKFVVTRNQFNPNINFSSDYRYPALKMDAFLGIQIPNNRTSVIGRMGFSLINLTPSLYQYVRVPVSNTSYYSFRPTSGNLFFFSTELGMSLKR